MNKKKLISAYFIGLVLLLFIFVPWKSKSGMTTRSIFYPPKGGRYRYSVDWSRLLLHILGETALFGGIYFIKFYKNEDDESETNQEEDEIEEI